MNRIKKVFLAVVLSVISTTSVFAMSCTCTSGDMIITFKPDGTIQMSCSNGGRVKCTFPSVPST